MPGIGYLEWESVSNEEYSGTGHARFRWKKRGNSLTVSAGGRAGQSIQAIGGVRVPVVQGHFGNIPEPLSGLFPLKFRKSRSSMQTWGSRALMAECRASLHAIPILQSPLCRLSLPLSDGQL